MTHYSFFSFARVLLIAAIAYTPIAEVASQLNLPAARLMSFAPNPFVDNITLTVQVDRAAHVSIKIEDAYGRLITILHDGMMGSGRNKLTWEAQHAISAGVYFIRFECERYRTHYKIVCQG